MEEEEEEEEGGWGSRSFLQGRTGPKAAGEDAGGERRTGQK
jgi:hypothetical protein